MMSLKKLTWQIIAVLMMLVFGAGAALAVAVAPVPKIITIAGGPTGTISGAVGADVIVPIAIDDSTDVGGIAFTIKYDSAILTFLGLEKATTAGWNINDGTAFLAPTPVNGVTYYNPYSHADPYSDTTAYPYITTANATLFYQYNDWQENGVSVGRVLVSGASAVPLTGTTLFNAKFHIKGGINGTKSPLSLSQSIISNAPQAGYAVPTFLPVLVGTTHPDATTGMYTSLDFPVLPFQLVPGYITISAPVYNLGGNVAYGSSTGPAANGSQVTLSRVTTAGDVFSDQTTVVNGLYSFTGKPAGSYKLTIHSNDFGYNDYTSGTAIALAANISNADAVLPAKPQPVRISSTVTAGYIPGLLVKVVDGNGAVMGIYNVAAGSTSGTGSWTSALLPAGGTYHWTLDYGRLSSGTDATTFDTTSLKKISGTISGLPAGGGSVTAASVNGQLMKTVQVTTSTFSLDNLVPANDYVVSAVAAGLPVTYFNNQTDVTAATAVDVSTTDAANVNFNFTTAGNGKITGRITKSTNSVSAGVSGITVYGFSFDTFALIQAKTDGTGNFELSVKPGAYEVFVINDSGKLFYFYSADGTGTPTQNESNAVLRTVVTSSDTIGNTNIDITEADKTLTGKVTFRTAAGDPAPNVLITVSTDTQRAQALTGQDGKYTVGGLISGTTYNVNMKPLTGNYAVQSANIVAGAGTDQTKDFIIDTGAVLSGTVTDSVSTAAVSGAMLYLTDQTTGSLVGGRIYFSGTDGKYSIRDIQSGSYTLEVTDPDYRSASVDIIIGSADLTQDVALQKGAYFKGTVTDNANIPNPLAGVTIIVTDGTTTLYTVTNSSGSYSVFGLNAATNYIIITQKKGYDRQVLSNKQPSTGGTTVNFTLAPPVATFQISGAVTSNSVAVSNAMVLVSSKTKNFFAVTNTGTDGTYVVKNLTPSSDYQIIVIPSASSNLPIQAPVSFAVTNANVVQNFTISVGQEISGTVSGPPAGARVYVFLYNGSAYLSYTTLSSGAFKFKGLTAGSNYKLMFVSAGYTTQWYSGQTSNGAATAIDITSGSKTDVTVTLTTP